MSGHRFLSWIRFGLAAARGDSALENANPVVQTRITFAGAAEEVAVKLHGPGDIARLDATVIRRREPAPFSTKVSPNRFAFVELAPADLPWRVSPDPAGSRVRPWLALVIVPASAPFAASRTYLAFTSFATCPLPPPENRLDLAITAGEKTYSHPATL